MSEERGERVEREQKSERERRDRWEVRDERGERRQRRDNKQEGGKTSMRVKEGSRKGRREAGQRVPMQDPMRVPAVQRPRS